MARMGVSTACTRFSSRTNGILCKRLLTSSVVISQDSGLRIISLNRQEELNSFDMDTANELKRRLEAWSNNEMITTLVLQGRGGIYCGGIDLDWLATHPESAGDLFATMGDVYSTVAQYSKPLVSMMNGDVSGAGLGLANTPYRVVTGGTRFAVPEASFGLVPDGPAVKMLLRADNSSNLPMAAYLCLSGRFIDGAEMVHCGLATHIVDDASVELISRHLSSISYASPQDLAIAIGDALSLFCDTNTNPTMAENAWNTVHKIDDTIEIDDRGPDHRDVLVECFSCDSVVETWTRLEARASSSRWAELTLGGMQLVPPVALFATRRLLEDSIELSDTEAAALAQKVALRLSSGSAFTNIVENASRGIRARQTTLEDLTAVSKAEVDALFS
jgi:enoyl-CoA hydratase/carnithine racemase